MIKAVLFDMDGVLVDSEDLSIGIGIRYFEKKGYKADKKNFLSHLGTGMADFVLGTASELGALDVTVEDADGFYHSVYAQELKKHDIAMPGAREALENFKKAGLKIAICSSAQRWKVEANIKALGLEPSFFDVVIAEDMIKRNKSNPDIYLLGAAMTGVDLSDAIVIEDSPGGVLAGVNAGIRTVAVSTTMTRKEALSCGADRVISDVKEISSFTSAEALEEYLFGIADKEVLYGASYVKATGLPLREEVVDKCIKAALSARMNAYTPYSEYKVGAAVLSASSGRIYKGCNIENSSYGATICAERNAVTTALAAEGGLGGGLLVVASEDYPPAPPCAVCLQVLSEFAKADTKVILVSTSGEKVEYSFSELLPKPFVFPTMRKS